MLQMMTSSRSGSSGDRTSSSDDNETVSAGGRPEFEVVLRLYHKKVYNLVYRLLGNPDEAADLTQETFVNAYKAYSRFHGTSEAVYAWLCRIAVNNCKNKFKEMSRRGRHELRSLDEPVEMSESEVEFQLGDDSYNPEGVFERRELESRIQDAIQGLPPEFRVVVVLRDMNGLSYKEIAEATGLSLEIVKARIFRGRGALRRQLAPYIESEQ